MCVSQDDSPDNSAQVSVTKVDNCDFSVQHRASSSLIKFASLNVIFSKLKFHQMVANLINMIVSDTLWGVHGGPGPCRL